MAKVVPKDTVFIVECNKGHKHKLDEPNKIIPRTGKRLALKINLVPFLEERGFEILKTLQNVDDVIVAKKKLVHRDKIGSEELIISDRLCFIHLPKTGGAFVRKYLTENVPGLNSTKVHTGIIRLEN